MAAPVSNSFLLCVVQSRKDRLTVCLPVLISARGERERVLPGLSLGRSTLPWAAVMLSQSTAAAPVRDDRGRGFACAKAAGASTSRGVGTSVTAKTPNAGGWSGAGKRRGGRPDDASTMPAKPGMPRLSVRAVSVLPIHRKHRRTPKLRPRVVTQQKLFCRPPCATGRGAMNHP